MALFFLSYVVVLSYIVSACKWEGETEIAIFPGVFNTSPPQKKKVTILKVKE